MWPFFVRGNFMDFDFDWVDAFADAPFGGNGCAVVHGGAVLSDAVCMAYVRETSLVECTFTGPSEVADLRVKYYLASREIPFAGHPTIATVAALLHRGKAGQGKLTLETGAGIVALDVDGALITMTQVAPTFGARIPAEVVAKVGGIPADAIIAAPQVVSTGLPFCITVLRDREAVESLRFDMDGVRRLSRPTWSGIGRSDGAILAGAGGCYGGRRHFRAPSVGTAQSAGRPVHRVGDRGRCRVSLGAWIDFIAKICGRAGPWFGPSRPGSGRGAWPTGCNRRGQGWRAWRRLDVREGLSAIVGRTRLSGPWPPISPISAPCFPASTVPGGRSCPRPHFRFRPTTLGLSVHRKGRKCR